MVGNLTAELASDGAASSRDQHLFTLHVGEDGIKVYLNGVSSEEILHLHIAELADTDFPVYQLIHAGQGTELTVGLFTDIQDL